MSDVMELPPAAPRRGRPPKADAKPGKQKWRIELLNTQVTALARIVRTQEADNEAEAWEKFKAAMLAQINGLKDQKVREIHLTNWNRLMESTDGELPERGRIITDDQAAEELRKCTLVSPPDSMR